MTDGELYSIGFIEARDKLEEGFDHGSPAVLRRVAAILDREGEPYSQGAAACLRLHADDLEGE